MKITLFLPLVASGSHMLKDIHFIVWATLSVFILFLFLVFFGGGIDVLDKFSPFYF